MNFKKEFILTIDASCEGLGAILSQVGDDGIERPNAFASRALRDNEKKYAPFYLENMAVLFGCRYFKPYLVGSKHFTIRTDHQPICSALGKTQNNALARMQAELQEYLPFRIQYLHGSIMPSDALSRLGIDSFPSENDPLSINEISEEDTDAQSPGETFIQLSASQIRDIQK